MRKFEELTDKEKNIVCCKFLEDVLGSVISGEMRFNDSENGGNLQATIDKQITKAKSLKCLHFAGEFILSARFNPGKGNPCCEDGMFPVKAVLMSIAKSMAENSNYQDKDKIK